MDIHQEPYTIQASVSSGVSPEPLSLVSRIEAILFASGSPLHFSELAVFFEVGEDAIRDAVQSLSERFALHDHAYGVLLYEGTVQLVIAGSYAEDVRRFFEKNIEGELSRAALETLTVIAYLGPVHRAYIEQIRGVNCSQSLRNLLIRGLIEEAPDIRTQEKGYRVTQEFVRTLGIESLSALPDYSALRNHEYLAHILGGEASSAPVTPSA